MKTSGPTALKSAEYAQHLAAPAEHAAERQERQIPNARDEIVIGLEQRRQRDMPLAIGRLSTYICTYEGY
jgi:hypothetical protein